MYLYVLPLPSTFTFHIYLCFSRLLLPCTFTMYPYLFTFTFYLHLLPLHFTFTFYLYLFVRDALALSVAKLLHGGCSLDSFRWRLLSGWAGGVPRSVNNLSRSCPRNTGDEVFQGYNIDFLGVPRAPGRSGIA